MKINELYKKQGFVVIKRFLTKQEVKSVLSSLKKFCKSYEPKRERDINFTNKNSSHSIHDMEKWVWIKKIRQKKTLKKIIKHLLEENPKNFGSEYFAKPAKSGLPSPLHQDNFYWCRKPNKALTAYIALNDQSNKNGSIEYFLASHKLKTFDHLSSKVKGFSSFIDQKKIPNLPLLKPNLRMGDVIFHHCNIIHKAGKNNHQKLERKALALAIYSFKSRTDLKMMKRYLKNKPRTDIDKKII